MHRIIQPPGENFPLQIKKIQDTEQNIILHIRLILQVKSTLQNKPIHKKSKNIKKNSEDIGLHFLTELQTVKRQKQKIQQPTKLCQQQQKRELRQKPKKYFKEKEHNKKNMQKQQKETKRKKNIKQKK